MFLFILIYFDIKTIRLKAWKESCICPIWIEANLIEQPVQSKKLEWEIQLKFG